MLSLKVLYKTGKRQLKIIYVENFARTTDRNQMIGIIVFCYFLAITVSTQATNCTLETTKTLRCSNVASTLTLDSSLDTKNYNNLTITDSRIQTIPAKFFKDQFPNLIYITLDNAGVEEISPGAFEGLSHLQDITFKGNPIKVLHPESLSKNIYHLDLSRNNLSQIEDGVFAGMEKLKSVNLQENQLEEFKPGFMADCGIVEVLIASHNKIQFVKSNIFPITLRKIDLSNNEISEIEAESFPQLWTSVDVSYNRLNILRDYLFSRDSSGVNSFNASHNRIKFIEVNALFKASSLNTLDLSYNEISDLKNKSICGIESLTHLYISHNRLTGEDVTLLVDCLKLEFLDVSNNRINSLQGQVFKNSNLHYLDLSNNEIHELDISTFSRRGGRTDDITILNLSHNKIGNINSKTFQDDELLSLDLSNNKIVSISAETFDSKLHTLDLQYNKIKIFGNWFVYSSDYFHQGLDYFNVSHNEIERVESDSLVNIRRIRELDLSFNKISDIGTNGFSSMTLEKLYLDHNRLTVLKEKMFRCFLLVALNISFNNIEILEPKVFEGLERLRFLDLSYNKIETIDPRLFAKNSFLNQVYLHHNHLTVLQDQIFGSSPFLNYLDFSYNKINNISLYLYPMVVNYNKFHLDLSHNELEYIERDILPRFPRSTYVVIELNIKHNSKLKKEDVEELVHGFERGYNICVPHLFINTSLDLQSCQNFKKDGKCTISEVVSEDECAIESKGSGNFHSRC